MKLVSIFTLTTLASCCAIDHVAAVNCTMEDNKLILLLSDNMLKDASCDHATWVNHCPLPPCLAQAQALVDNMPDCWLRDAHIKATSQKMLDDCKPSKAAAASSNNNSPSTATKSSAAHAQFPATTAALGIALSIAVVSL